MSNAKLNVYKSVLQELKSTSKRELKNFVAKANYQGKR